MCEVDRVLGEVLRDRRAQLGLSLREAARRIGISPSYLVALEQGRNPSTGRAPVPSPVILAAIGHVFGVELRDLLDACGASVPQSAHLLLFQTGRSYRSPVAAARQVFAGRVDGWVEIADPRAPTDAASTDDILVRAPGPLGLPAGRRVYDASETHGAFADVLAEGRPQPGARVGLVFGANSLLLRSLGDPSAVLASETTWEFDIAALCQASFGAPPTANVCVYRDADIKKVGDRLDRLEALIGLFRTHPRVAVEDGRGRLTTGPAAIEAILLGARPPGVTQRAWRSLASAAATAPQALA